MVPRASRCPACILLIASLLLDSSDVFAQRSVPFRPSEDPSVLAPKLQKELGKALEALRANQPVNARTHLDAVYKFAPGDADANFLFGVYSAETDDWVQAKSYWEKVLVLDPSYLNALLSLGEAFLRENKSAEAAEYLNHAVEAQPTSWRAHAVLADACLRQGLLDESIEHAERALALGHGHAEIVQPVLARALHLRGDRERATQVLQAYIKDHLTEAAAAKQLEDLQASFAVTGEPSPGSASPSPWPKPLLPASAFLSSNWLPPDIDDKIPSVEPGVACNLEEVLQKSGNRIQEFVANVDKFTATEVVSHESINKWGFASRPLKFEFDYLVSIKANRLGLLAVDEQRNSHILSAKFPDGIVVTGLPALVLIFHPH